MNEETFRPRRPGVAPTQDVENMEEYNMVDKEEESPPAQAVLPPSIKGTPPAEFMQAMRAAQASTNGGEMSEPKKGFGQMKQESPKPQQIKSFENNSITSNEHLKELLNTLRNSTAIYEEVELPSKGRFYDGENGPSNGIVSIRPMTGEEEQILATPRFVRRGQAINMIFQKCIKENNFRPENLLTIDRTYLLIYLRGISYSTKYDVEVKCPECEKKFGTTINLDEMYVEGCPDNFGPILQDVLPTTKLPFSYRLSTGKDEQEITDYRDRRIKAFGDASADDTLTYRTAALLNEIDGIKMKNDLQVLLKNLPINDVSHIRNCINEPPFGVDTNIEIVCPSCLQDFEVDLPLEANFFFPRRKKATTQV